MPKPPRYIYLSMLCLLVGLFGCTNRGSKESRTFPFISPLLAGIPTVNALEPPRSTPFELLPPRFEESSIPPWARPVAPENSFNRLVSPNARYLVYLSGHPGTRYTSLYSTPLAGGPSVPLNHAVFADSILYPTISPDSTRVVYYPGYDGSGLYSVTITGTEHITLTTDTVREAVLSADGKWVVYWGEDETGEHGLYSIPPAGGKRVWLGGWLPSSSSFQITPDSRYVVFVSVGEGYDRPGELYSVPIQGGEQVYLNPGANLGSGSPFFITPDSQTVIFGNLYTVPIQGGTLRQLNTLAGMGLPDYEHIGFTQLSPDGRWLLYHSGAVQGNWRALFSVPVAGGAPIQLNDAPPDGEGMRGFQISADSQYVLYQQGPRDSQDLRSFRVPISGGTPVPFPAEWRWIQTSPDSRWYVYGIRGESSGTDIYSVPVEGGTPVKLNLLMPRGSAVAWTQISPDSRTLYYATSKDAGGGMPPIDGFYQVSIEGGEAREVMGGDGRIPAFDLLFLSGSQITFAEADYDGDGRYALYAYPPAPPPAPVESHAAPQTLLLPALHH
ncbi:MAG: hypothetical protein IT328_09705 [Caldilineaceae bacterium]|nr:hypothetical protein [Caldilineaceae bacterium]